MEHVQHNEDVNVEEAALEAGFTGTDEKLPVESDKPKDAEKVEAIPPEKVEETVEDKPLTRAELQAVIEKNAALESQLAKMHDKTFGKIGELQQKIDEARKVATRLNPKARERLLEEYGPGLAEILFDGVEDVDTSKTIQTQNVKVEDIVDARVKKEKEAINQAFEIRLLKRDHPDFEKVVVTPDFLKYKATLTTQDQQEFDNTWDADIVSSRLTAFKTWKQENDKVEQAKADKNARLQKKLESAIQPKGVSRPSSYEDDDEEAAMKLGFSGG